MAVTFNTKIVDTDGDKRISEAEWNKWYDNNKTDLNRGADVNYDGTNVSWQRLQEMKGNLVSPAEPRVENLSAEEVKELKGKIASIDQQIEELLQKKAQLEKAPDAEKPEDKNLRTKQLEAVEKNLQEIRNKQKQQIKQYQRQIAKDGANKDDLSTKAYRNAGMKVPEGKAQTMSGKAEVPAGKAQTISDSRAGAEQSGTAQPKASTGTTKSAGWGTLPSNWGAQTMSGPKLDTAAYAQSLFMEDQVMGAWDSINADKNRGQKLMQVLFYYMRMAMSGDLTAMYNMMKAVLYIISKDKALQQVHMANKLIELQDASRKATDKLLNFTTDPNDPNSQTEFTKILQSTKAESDSIATSQKLIAQMMEEMAQIVETLTNTTKGALEAAGRVLRTVSRFS